MQRIPSRPAPPSSRPRSLLVEGWRGINHSIALVNQHQLLALARLDGLRLSHRDLPFAFAHWSTAVNGSGLPEADQRRLDALPPPDDAPDAIYRICAPFRTGAPGDAPTTTFMVTELGLTAASFAEGARRSSFTRDGNSIVTPSRWSRDRIVDDGFPAEKITVIPHGVDRTIFRPLDAAERVHNRRALGVADDECVFLNVGAPMWNKGIDLLVAAFARLRSEGRRMRLLLKDQRDVYGLTVDHILQAVHAASPGWLNEATVAAISVLPDNLTTAQLRGLYGIADCYVSPYRAEGFNLPVLEAIACGVPVIVTRGGATDDFCDDAIAIRIRATPGSRTDAEGAVGRFVTPDADELVAAMDAVARGQTTGGADREGARGRVLERCDWTRIAEDLRRLTVGDRPVALRRFQQRAVAGG